MVLLERENMSIQEKLNKVQVELNAPKNLYNKFAGYAYRNCEGILTGLKPLLEKYGLTITLSDEVKQLGDRFYVVASAMLTDIETGEIVCNTAYAREDNMQKGLTPAQITGSCSSYARKYALNGLLAIDDVQDDDTRDNVGKEEKGKAPVNYHATAVSKPAEPNDQQIMDLRDLMF